MPEPRANAEPEALASMDAMLAEAERAFVDWARKALKTVRPRVAELAGSSFEPAREAIFSVFHDLKGAGGGVGMDLMTEIGESGCAYLRHFDSPSKRAAKIAAAHVAAAEGVLAARIKGDGGAAGRQLIEKLRASSEAA